MRLRVTVDKAEENLRELLSKLSPGEEMVITDGALPIATIVRQEQVQKRPRKPGLGKGIISVVDDSIEDLSDFEEYMS